MKQAKSNKNEIIDDNSSLQFTTGLKKDYRLLKKAFLMSIVLHLLLFWIVFPGNEGEIKFSSTSEDVVYVYSEPPPLHRVNKLKYKIPIRRSVAIPNPSPDSPGIVYNYHYEGRIPSDMSDEEKYRWNQAAHKRKYQTEEYDRIYENPFLDPLLKPLSTFSIDVDTASYANTRRFLTESELPPKDAVRIEETINYFTYDYETPDDDHPFEVITELSSCPWNTNHKLIHIGIQGKKIDAEDLPPSNLVFLLDVSGSMSSENKLPLVIKAFKLLVQQLRDEDRVSIVVYAGSEGLALPSTPGSNKDKILASLESLEAGGTTAGGAGIKLAYKIAKENFIEDGNNRVILATDGDFNVGISSTSDLVRLIEEKRKSGIFLSVLGFGTGNYKDSRMENLADKGNGNYSYIDNIREAKKVFVNEMGGTLFAIAKDVKIQIEFNPIIVKAYRLIGYENRLMAAEDFNDDTKDAGELGAGHTVTAMYEIVSAGREMNLPKVDEMRYQKTKIAKEAFDNDELMVLKLRYKKPDEDKSRLIETQVEDDLVKFAKTSDNFRFSSAVAAFGMLLRDSKYKGEMSFNAVFEIAKSATGKDKNGYRAEFLKLVETADLLTNAKAER